MRALRLNANDDNMPLKEKVLAGGDLTPTAGQFLDNQT